jgi:Zn-dependent M28 family amino/carboxypeptidase
MSNGITTSRRAAVALTAAAGLWCTSVPVAHAATDPTALGQDLARRVTVTAVNRHLIALQRIAEQNNGTRAIGTPGFDASLAYVSAKLRDAGFDVTTPAFDYVFEQVEKVSLTVAGAAVEVQRMQYSANSPAGGATGPLVMVPADPTPGCEIEDYAGLNVTGAIAVIPRGSCTFALKQTVAAQAGAIGAIIVNNRPGPLNGTLGDPALGVIPTVGVTTEVGATLTAGATATLDLQALVESRVGHNVIAQTRTGRADNVVMLGAHLDSVPEGPGINDNGSGTATLLETALRLGSRPDADNAVRFAWWGAEELGLIGSSAYVAGLSFEQQLDIALYLNFDMTASPNAAYFVYDGDDSDAAGSGPGPYGSAQLEKTLVDYLQNTKGVPTRGTDFDGRSDYGPFIDVGIPAGGTFTGAEGVKTPEQAALWGGTANAPFDKCYHQACDNLGNLDRTALDRNADAVAFATGLYAVSTEAVNGVPPREERAETVSAASAFAAFVEGAAPSAGAAYRGHLALS